MLRDKIIHDITSDPLWYASILAKRTERAFAGATPIRFGFMSHYFDVPFSAWVALPMLLLVLVARKWDQVALLLFYTSNSLPTVLIFSRRGFDTIASFHILAFAVICCWGIWAVHDALSRRQAKDSG